MSVTRNDRNTLCPPTLESIYHTASCDGWEGTSGHSFRGQLRNKLSLTFPYPGSEVRQRRGQSQAVWALCRSWLLGRASPIGSKRLNPAAEAIPTCEFFEQIGILSMNTGRGFCGMCEELDTAQHLT